MNFYGYLHSLNEQNPSTALDEEIDNTEQKDTEEDKKEEEKREDAEEEHIHSEAPKPPMPRWFNEIRQNMKDGILLAAKDQYEADVKAKKDEELKKRQEAELAAQRELQTNVEKTGGNINGLGNGDFKDPNANNPERVQKEGSMATVDSKASVK